MDIRTLVALVKCAAIALIGIGLPTSNGLAKPIDLEAIDNWRENSLVTFTTDKRWIAHLSAPSKSLEEFLKLDRSAALTKYPRVKDNIDKQYHLKIQNRDGKLSHDIFSHSGFTSSTFSENAQWFGVLRPQEYLDKGNHNTGSNVTDLVLLDLKSGDQKVYKKVNQFALARGSLFMVSGGATRQLIVKDLLSGEYSQLGPVEQVAMNEQGSHLAWTVSSDEGYGNGLYITPTHEIAVNSLDSDSMGYKNLQWMAGGDALSAIKVQLKSDNEDLERRKKIIAATNLLDGVAKTYEISWTTPGFPDGMNIYSNDGSASGGRVFSPPWSGESNQKLVAEWSKDRSALIFYLTERKKNSELNNNGHQASDSHGMETDGKQSAVPDLALWHWEEAVFPNQKGQNEESDQVRLFPFVYWVEQEKLVGLIQGDEDEDFEILGFSSKNILRKNRYLLGKESSGVLEQRLSGNLFVVPGDIYLVDLQTGTKSKILDGVENAWGDLSPNGRYFSFLDDGNFHVYDMLQQESYNITSAINVTFLDNNSSGIEEEPIMEPVWTSDSGLILEDNWDIWHFPVSSFSDPNRAVKLTPDGLEKRINYSVLRVNRLPSPNAVGSLDLDYPTIENSILVHAFDKSGMKTGITRLDLGAPGNEWLIPLARKTISGARDIYALYFPYVNSVEVDEGARLIFDLMDFDETSTVLFDLETKVKEELFSDNLASTPFRKQYDMSSGVQVLNYKCDWNDWSFDDPELEGSLILPAKYEKGRQYPTVVMIYEAQMAVQGVQFRSPSLDQTSNPYDLASNGYAVLLLNVRFQATKPGESGLNCLLPAIDSAIESGVVDEERIGLYGHSWGGYQTLYYTTQTDRFAGAIASAGISSLIGMYTETFRGNRMPSNLLVEVGQGRMKNTIWDNLQSYIGNSALFHADKLNTPLLILHNDQDRAVPFNQGRGYFLALQRLQKPSVLLQYRRGGHVVTGRYNLIDCRQRYFDFWDHFLKGESAPDWWSEGIEPFKMKKHLEERFSR